MDTYSTSSRHFPFAARNVGRCPGPLCAGRLADMTREVEKVHAR